MSCWFCIHMTATNSAWDLGAACSLGPPRMAGSIVPCRTPLFHPAAVFKQQTRAIHCNCIVDWLTSLPPYRETSTCQEFDPRRRIHDAMEIDIRPGVPLFLPSVLKSIFHQNLIPVLQSDTVLATYTLHLPSRYLASRHKTRGFLANTPPCLRPPAPLYYHTQTPLLPHFLFYSYCSPISPLQLRCKTPLTWPRPCVHVKKLARSSKTVVVLRRSPLKLSTSCHGEPLQPRRERGRKENARGSEARQENKEGEPSR